MLVSPHALDSFIKTWRCFGSFRALSCSWWKGLWRRSWRRWIHKTSLNTEQTSSANRYFFLPQGLRSFYKYRPRAECTQRSQQSVLPVDPSAQHDALKMVKKPLNLPKMCLELETKRCVMIPSQWKHRITILVVHAIQECAAQQDLVSSTGESRRCLRVAQAGHHPPAPHRLPPNPQCCHQAQQGSLWAQTPKPVAHEPPEPLVVPVCAFSDTLDPNIHPCTCSSEQLQMMLPALGSMCALPLGFLGLVWGFFSLFLLTWRSTEVKDNTFVAGKELT